MFSFNKLSPMALYFISIVFLVLSNIIRSHNLNLYYVLLVIGIIFFFLGLYKKIKTKH